MRKQRVDLFIDSECSVQHVDCRSIVDTTTPLLTHVVHRSSAVSWTERTDIHCWHCCAPFEGTPIPIPSAKDARTGKYVVHGVFCSFSCAKGYISEQSPFDMGRKLMLLKEVAMLVFGKDVSDIVAAPPRLCLDRFGGNLSLSEFRSAEVQHLIETPPFLPHLHASTSSRPGRAEEGKRWTVQGIRRPSAPAVVETAGKRGMYFDFLKKQDEAERAAAMEVDEAGGAAGSQPTAPTRTAAACLSEGASSSLPMDGTLSRFMK